MRGDSVLPRACLLLLLLAACLVRPGSAMGDKCTNVCTCKWKSGKRTVECRGRALKAVPDDVDPETQVLDLSDNNIKQLHSKIFIKVRLTNLQRLYLRGCHLEYIDREAFAGLTNLVELDLSHNRLASIPSASLSKASFLRDLVLAHNPLGKVQKYAFKETPNLVKLDLSNAELKEVAENGFQGLEMLESLKISHNRLSMLEPGTLDPLSKLTSIELHENPWTCDCQLREMKAFLVRQNLPTLIAPICHRPEQLVNKSFAELELDDFACRPVMLIVSRYAEATIGENASIVCSVTAIPPAKVKWIWNGKVYTNHSTVNAYQRILINEEGSGGGFRKLSTLVLTNAQETDSSNFFCVAENPAGSVEANFTLHVSLRTAGMSTLGSGQIAGISAALVILILLILLTIMVLFMRLRRMPQKEVKSPAPAGGTDGLPMDGCATNTPGNTQDPTSHPQSATSTVSRRKPDDVETTSFNEPGKQPAVSPGGHQLLGYAQRPTASQLLMESHDYLLSRSAGYEEAAAQLASRLQHSAVAAGPACYSSQASLMPIDNPDLIRDTGRGADELQQHQQPEYHHHHHLDDSKLLYSECLGWEAQGRELLSRPSVSAGGYASTREQLMAPSPQPPQQPQQQPQQQETFPPGAKQIRVWQKGVPVLPPVSALKRVLGSTRSSPDEGYQEGTGTDV